VHAESFHTRCWGSYINETRAAVFAVGALASQGLIINTPANAIQCEPTQITWAGGVAPFSLTITDESSGATDIFPDLTGDSLTWFVDFPAGSEVGLSLKDSAGDLAQSAPFVINGGIHQQCL